MPDDAIPLQTDSRDPGSSDEVAPPPAPRPKAEPEKPRKDGTARKPRPSAAQPAAAPAASAGSGTGRKKRAEVPPDEEPRRPGDGTARRKRAAAESQEQPVRSGPSPVLLAVGGAVVGALVIGAAVVALRSPEKTPVAPAPAPTAAAPADDPAALWKRLTQVQERLAKLEESAAPSKADLDRAERELNELRGSALREEARGPLSRAAKQVEALREKLGGGAPAASGAPGAPKGARAEREARLASIDEGLKELAFVVEARLYSALQGVPSSLLTLGAEEQQGRGLRDRLRKTVGGAKGAPRELIEVSLRPEWVGFLGAAGYETIGSWAEDYLGEFRTSEAWRYWEQEQLPRLRESRARARRFEEALAAVEAAWAAKDHAKAVQALAAFREDRSSIWGTALLGWVEREDVARTWGAIPLRPDLEEEEDGPTASTERRPERPRRGGGSGTGFFVTKRHVLTNQHVVDDAEQVTIQMEGKPPARGKVLARDAALDVALVEVAGLEGRPLGFCRESLAVGEAVYVYGYGAMVTGSGQLSNEQAVWTEGALSQVQQEPARRLIVFDASVNPGNSGGPLVDCGGNWIGVVVAKTRSVSELAIDGRSFAVHGEDALAWTNERLKAAGGGAVTLAKAPGQPLRPSAIARKLPASVVRIVVGAE